MRMVNRAGVIKETEKPLPEIDERLMTTPSSVPTTWDLDSHTPTISYVEMRADLRTVRTLQ